MRAKQQVTRVLGVVVAALVLGAAAARKGGAEGNVAAAQTSWPKWLGYFPGCVFGDTCFFHVYSFCRKKRPNAGMVPCGIVALDWCDLSHLYQLSGGRRPNPPQGKALASPASN